MQLNAFHRMLRQIDRDLLAEGSFFQKGIVGKNES